MELKIHDFQISILRELLFKPGARFRDLKKVDVTNDHFTFHINRLVEEGLVRKDGNKYFLTDEGKEFASRLDTDALKIEKQAKILIALHPVRVVDGKLEYLIHRRSKDPYFGWCGSQSGKIRWGETPEECARRELMEETGLTGEFSLKMIVHYHVFNKEEKFLEDKYFWIYRVDNVKGELIEKMEDGENIWMTETDYRKLPHVFASFEVMERAVLGKELVYEERKEIVDEY
ncbi:MAG: NUDIX domain-containing protein [Patescibacteria group bacterium]